MNAPYDDIAFPIIGFAPDGSAHVCLNIEEFTLSSLRGFDDGDQVGVEIIDSGGAAWRIAKLDWVGGGGFFSRNKVVHDLEPLPGASLAEVQARACKALDLDWSYGQPELGADGVWIEGKEVVERDKAKIRALDSIASVCQFFGELWFH